MKNKFLLGMMFSIILIISMTLNSCKKQYTCDCDEFENGVETGSGLIAGFKSSKEWDAEARCNAHEHTHYTGYNDTIVISYECTLTQD